MLVEGGRLMGRTGLLTVRLEEVRRGRGVVALRGRHVVHVARVERGLVKQGGVELVALTTGIREKRKVVVEVRRQVCGLRLVVEGQRSVGAGWLLAKRGGVIGVENRGVGEVGPRKRSLLLLRRRRERWRLLRAQETRVVEGIIGWLSGLFQSEAKTDRCVV